MKIDRAIEILDPEHRENYDGMDEVNEACRMGMEALERMKWIPCSERLPEQEGTYIVVTNKVKPVVTTARFYDARDLRDYKGNVFGHDDAHFQANRYVTHWMPLPEPPEEVLP